MEGVISNKNRNVSSEDGDQFPKCLKEERIHFCTRSYRGLSFMLKELEMSCSDTSSSNNTHSQAENEIGNYKNLKRSSEDEADQGQTKSKEEKPHANPKKILQIMRKMIDVPHLTRLGFANPTHSTPLSSSLVRCGGTQNGADAAQYPLQPMSITPRYSMPVLCSCAIRWVHSPMNNNTHPALTNQSDNLLIMQMFQTPSYMQILNEAAAILEIKTCRPYVSPTTHPHPLHSQISKFKALIQGLPMLLLSKVSNESCGSIIITVKGEFCYQNNHNSVPEDCQVYGNEAMFANICSIRLVDLNIFEDLGFGEHVPFLNSYIQDNGAM
ncbi:hypothetical protein ACJRO7_030674 [Eucalyptus globulus]|uniref:Uncharacterized protein n=1 Tax=Eucalyptus globulus TaxID=34317 RepID=A0ABD3JIJ8_EUCGL